MEHDQLVVLRARAQGAEAAVRGGTFTGTVWGDPLLPAQNNVLMNTVYFSPCSRTYWHRHEGGQLIQVSSGEGWIAQRGGTPIKIRVGEAVWTPPGVEHWHGSDTTSFLVHVATSLGETEWLEEVSAEEFEAATAAATDRN
jgi:quercetin dioxygenase-like cupin family protein